MVPNMPVPMVIILMEVISLSSLAKEEKYIILVTYKTRIFQEIITLIICSASLFLQFCVALNQLARAAFVQNVQFSHVFKRDKFMLRKDPLLC